MPVVPPPPLRIAIGKAKHHITGISVKSERVELKFSKKDEPQYEKRRGDQLKKIPRTQ